VGERKKGVRIVSPTADIDWYYFCKARDAMVPLPPGHKPVIDGEEEAV
jgi:hypothetical protein